MSRIAIVLTLWSTTLFAQDDFVIPVTASSPHVFLSLTDERDPDEGIFTSEMRFPPQGDSLPSDQPAHYEVAIYDTGAPATIMGSRQANEFGIIQSGFGGTEVLGVGGVGDPVDAISSDPLGVYVAGVDSLLTNPRTGEQIVDRAQLKGSITNSVIYGVPGPELPTLVGTTTAVYYTTLVNYGDPRIIEYEGETYRSPAVTLAEQGTIARPSRRIAMTLVNAETPPTLVINLGGDFDPRDLRNNPSFPTIGSSFWLKANVTNNGVTRNQLSAVFDTGAQGSFVSEQLAAEMGFDVENDKPDFVVRLAGVTGVSQEVPGFYADEFHLPGTDGGLLLKNVPLVVYNLPNPRDGVNTLDALIGMNLFATRDLVINPERGNAFLGVSDPAVQQHRWTTTQASASFNAGQSWVENPGDPPLPPAIDWYADVTNVTGTPQEAVVNADVEVSMLVTKGHAEIANGSMTVRVQSERQLTVFGNAIIQEGSTVALDNGKLDALGIEVRGGSLSGSGSVAGEVLNQGTMIPGGENAIGSLEFPGSLDQLSNGLLQVDVGDNSNRDDLQFDTLEVGGAISLDGKLEVTLLEDYQPSEGDNDVFEIIRAGEELFGEFDSYIFNGTKLEAEFLVGPDSREIRDHVGKGQFVSVNYSNNTVEIVNYTALRGDADGDGVVTFDDFLSMALNYGFETDWVGGDFSGDGTVEFADFLILSDNFERSAARSATSISSVPEPSGMMLVILGYMMTLRFRSTRASKAQP